jgi:hypothetical protein
MMVEDGEREGVVFYTRLKSAHSLGADQEHSQLALVSFDDGWDMEQPAGALPIH